MYISRTFLSTIAILALSSLSSTSAAGGPLANVVRSGQSVARYSVADLGALPGGSSSYGFDMNNSGSVAGSSTFGSGTDQHAVVWSNGNMIDLGTLGGPNSEAGGPNGRGEAAVISETALFDPVGEDFCGFGDHRQCLAAIWAGGGLTQLSPFTGGQNSQAYGLNDRGQVVGFAENGAADPTCAASYQIQRFAGAIWDGAQGPVSLSPLAGDTVSFAFGINDGGQAVGGSGQCSDTTLPPNNPGAPHAVLWESDGTVKDLGNLGGPTNLASAINNRGDVDGAAQLPDGSLHAFLWTKESGMQDLGALPGDFVSVAPCCRTINDSRQITGFSIGGYGPRAFLWDNGTMADLNDIAPGSPLYLLFAQSINARGQIAGIGVTQSGDLHAFLATPNKSIK